MSRRATAAVVEVDDARHVKRRRETVPLLKAPAPAPPRAPKLTPARLLDAVGADTATKLMRLFGGRTIPKPERSERHQAIRARAKKDGYLAAAREFEITVRQVRRIVHGY